MPSPLQPKQRYQQALTAGYTKDPAQQQAVHALQQCFTALLSGQGASGVYLWGQVGRGKTWLMDMFFASLQEQGIASRRQHFHHFIAWLHRRLFALTGSSDPLQQVADELASEISVLCFDEFFISDIGDAMLLTPLFSELFKRQLTLVVTSNQAPLDLYADGFNREHILPALQQLQRQLTVIHLDGKVDHRLHGAEQMTKFWVKTANTNTSALANAFQHLTGATAKAGEIDIDGRKLNYFGCAPKAIWCSYSQICQGEYSAQDYMQLCQTYQHIFISEVPCLSAPPTEQVIARGTEDAAARVKAGDRVLPQLSRLDNGVRRFIALIDECYEQKVPVYIDAEVPMEQLYTQGALLFPYQRTFSRLQEMQRSDWGVNLLP